MSLGPTKVLLPLPPVVRVKRAPPELPKKRVTRKTAVIGPDDGRRKRKRFTGNTGGNRKGLPSVRCTRCTRMFFLVGPPLCGICLRRERLGDSLGIVVRCTQRGIDRRAEFGLPIEPIADASILYRRSH